MSDLKNSKKKWNIIVCFLVLFLIFLLLKINGYFDYSSKYGIESIYCEKDRYDLLFILDGDKKTTWGLLEEYSMNDSLVISFRHKRVVSEVQLDNERWKEYPTKSVALLYAVGDSGWMECEKETSIINGQIRFELNTPVEADQLLLIYMDDISGQWPITELYIR